VGVEKILNIAYYKCEGERNVLVEKHVELLKEKHAGVQSGNPVELLKEDSSPAAASTRRII
jgi:hypothetical protein